MDDNFERWKTIALHLVWTTLRLRVPEIPADLVTLVSPSVQADTPLTLYDQPAKMIDWQIEQIIRRVQDVQEARANVEAMFHEDLRTLAYHEEWPAIRHDDRRNGGICVTPLPAVACRCGVFLLALIR